MDSYKLQADEVVLFEGAVSLKGSEGSNMLLLTNFNIVVETTMKKMFKKAETSLLIYPIADIKIYNEQPQVKQKSCAVSVFLENDELIFAFPSVLAAHKFASKAIELVTGKPISARGAGKVKGAIGLVDDTLGIDTMGAISGIMENGLVKSILGGTKKKKEPVSAADRGDTIKAVADAATEVIGAVSDKEKAETSADVHQVEMSYDDKISAVKKLKELLDLGAISQEEFDAKKKELLGL